MHPRNPYAPTSHMPTCACSWRTNPMETPVFWFGGGMDLTPYYGFEEDAMHFHQTCKNALAPFGSDSASEIQKMVRRIFFPQTPQRTARRGRHLFRRFERAGFRHLLRYPAKRGRPLSCPPMCRYWKSAKTRPTANASAIFSSIAAAATSNSIW